MPSRLKFEPIEQICDLCDNKEIEDELERPTRDARREVEYAREPARRDGYVTDRTDESGMWDSLSGLGFINIQIFISPATSFIFGHFGHCTVKKK